MRTRYRGLTFGGLLILLGVVVVALVVLWHVRGRLPGSPVTEGQGLFRMEFSAIAVDGRPVSTLGSQGRVTLVNIFATWCSPCKGETSHLVKLYEERHADGLDMFMVSEEPHGVVKSFGEQFGVPFPLIADGRGIIEQVPRFRAFPTTVLIDKQGQVRYRIEGAYVDKIHKAVDTLLAEPWSEPVAAPDAGQ